MDIEIVHNPLNLHTKRLLKLTNSKEAERYFHGWLTLKHESFRIRYVFDHENRKLELSARMADNVHEAIRVLKPFIKEILPWKPNKLLKDIREKQFKGI